MLVYYELRSPLQLIKRPLATIWWTLFGHKSALFIRHQHEQRQIALRCLLLTFYCSIFGVCVVKWRPRRAADQLAEVRIRALITPQSVSIDRKSRCRSIHSYAERRQRKLVYTTTHSSHASLVLRPPRFNLLTYVWHAGIAPYVYVNAPDEK